MNIGERIRNLREAQSITQEELGKLIGVNKATINRYETGIIDIKRTIAIKLASVLKTTPAFIMGWDNEPTPKCQKQENNCFNFSSDAKQLLQNYNKLNPLGREKAQDYIKDLTENEKYTAPESELETKLNA